MKKFIAILCLFVGSLFLTAAQQDDNKYVNVDKKDTLTINVIADNSKQTLKDTQDLSSQFTKIVGNQTTVNQSLSEVLSTLSTGITSYTKEIEERNKSDGVLIDTYNFTSSEINNIIRTERWLLFITWLLTFALVLWIANDKIYIKKQSSNANLDTAQVWPILLIQCLVYGAWLVFMFYLIRNVLTLLFNGQYYVIKELISLYS
jgi:hypothetical protein